MENSTEKILELLIIITEQQIHQTNLEYFSIYIWNVRTYSVIESKKFKIQMADSFEIWNKKRRGTGEFSFLICGTLKETPRAEIAFCFQNVFFLLLLFIIVSSLLTVLVSEDKENLLGRQNKVTDLYRDER